jgi:hypothetical protein
MITRDGNISIFRLGLLAAGIGILALVIGIIALVTDQNSYRAPLEIAPYPGAESRGERVLSPVERIQYFVVGGGIPIETVATYYQQLLDQHYGQDANTPLGDREDCQRVEYESGEVPFQFTCVFNRSGFGFGGALYQTTAIEIQPGVRNNDPALNTEGMVVIGHRQTWTP